jgi:tetratricopeptide (TPR) repeat protein
MMSGPSTPDDLSRELRELVSAGLFREALARMQTSGAAPARQRPEVQLLGATAATRVGELSTAVSLAEAALEKFRARGDRDGRMRAVNLLGAIAFEHGRLPEAEPLFGEALFLARQLGDSLMEARASNNLASMAVLRGEADTALTMYRSALLSYTKLGDRRGTSEAYHNLGITFRLIREWHDSQDAATEAVRHAELLGERSLMALAVMGRAEIELERGDLDLAHRELERAAALAREAGDELGGAEVERLQAVLAIAKGDFESGLRLAEAALAVAQRFGSALLEGECAAAAARALRGLGRAAQAESRRALAAQRFEALGAVRWVEQLQREWEEGGEKPGKGKRPRKK